MPVACPSCGTQNPDGNKFCQNCGKPIAAAPVATAASAAAPPPPPPPPPPAPPSAPPGPAAAPPPGSYGQPGYSPYYAPAQPTAVHRTPWGLIIGVVVGLLVLMGGCGVVIAAVAAHPNPQPSPVAHNTSTPVPPTSAPTSAPTTAPTSTPRPTPTPTTTTKPPSGGGAVSTSSFSISAPNWKVLKQDQYSATLLSPQQDGIFFVISGPLQNQSNTESQVQSIVQQVAQKYPDAKVCVKPGTEQIAGEDGAFFGVCYTYTPQGGKAFLAADYFWIGVSSSNVLYEYEVFTAADTFDNFYNKTTLPVIDSIQWKS